MHRSGRSTSSQEEQRLQPAKREQSLAVIPTTQTPNSLSWIEGSDLARLGEAADRLEVPVYQRGVGAIGDDAAFARETAGESADIGFILRPTFPHLADAREVAAAIASLRALNPSSISFYNYGHMRLIALDWIAAALACPPWPETVT